MCGRVVALHQFHVGERAVGVDVDFLPGRRSGPGIVGVVVADDVAAARDVEEDGLVHVANDVVLDEIVGGATAQDDAVAIRAESVVGRIVKMAVAHDTAEGPGHRNVHAADGAVGLHVLDPAIGRVRHVDAARHLAVVAGIGAALDGQAFDAGPAHDRVAGLRDLREIRRRGVESPVQGRAQGDGAAGGVHAGDFRTLARRALAQTYILTEPSRCT